MSKAALNAFIFGGLSDLLKAVEIFTEAITADVKNYINYVHRATVYIRLCKWDAALEDAEKGSYTN